MANRSVFRWLYQGRLCKIVRKLSGDEMQVAFEDGNKAKVTAADLVLNSRNIEPKINEGN